MSGVGYAIKDIEMDIIIKENVKDINFLNFKTNMILSSPLKEKYN
jgi:hypothetical protein